MNMKSVMKTGWIAAAFFLTLTPVTRADDADLEHSVFSVGPRATFIKAKNADEGKWFAGAQLRAHLGDALALEGSIDYYRQHYAQNTTLKVYPVQASLLAYIVPRSPVSPYLLAGPGWYYTKSETPLGHDTQQRFGLHAGAGLEAKLSPSFSIDGSWRYLWIEDYTTQDQNALDKSYQDRASMVTIALSVHF
jgi:opacity protein-like surface antigen